MDNQDPQLPSVPDEPLTAEILLGRKVKDLRTQRSLSLRLLADKSGLNINTLSLLENGRTSPSVRTLQQLAHALDVPMAAFFDADPVEKQIVFSPAAGRPREWVGQIDMQNLGKNLFGSYVQPFLVTLPPGMGNGDEPVVHTGHELLYCLSGDLACHIDGTEYVLTSGDSLLFQARLPHRWKNPFTSPAQILLVLAPSDIHEKPASRHFNTQTEETK
ncbi:MAG: cupin domain-containing protein [Anaerolineaceae bacterium]